jgi:protocatechuate 3,4-dioxygenase beta subunit
MSSKRRHTLLGLAALTIFILLWLLRPQPSPVPTPGQAETQEPQKPDERVSARRPSDKRESSRGEAQQPSPTAPNRESQADREREMLETKMLWRTPIIFFGRVVDESNQPIAGVHVSYGANTADEQLTKEVRNEGATTSDARGIFEISGIRGRSFVLELSHPAYYNCESNPPGFDYAGELKSGNGVPDTEEKAMLFHMHSKGDPVALIERRGGLHKPADGTNLDFPLRGQTRSEIIGQLQVQAWKGEPDAQNNGRYDWRVRISVVGSGGVLDSTNEFAFVAPETGYRQTLEIFMSKHDLNWKPSVNKTLFFKLPNYFARGQANVDLYHDFYFSMQYFVNPDGSRNLENDPNQPFHEP